MFCDIENCGTVSKNECTHSDFNYQTEGPYPGVTYFLLTLLYCTELCWLIFLRKWLIFFPLLFLTPRPALSSHQQRTLVCLLLIWKPTLCSLTCKSHYCSPRVLWAAGCLGLSGEIANIWINKIFIVIFKSIKFSYQLDFKSIWVSNQFSYQYL